METVEELAVGVLVKVAAIAKCGQRLPVRVFVRDVPRADFEQDGRVAIVAEQLSREPVGQKGKVVFAVCRAALDQFAEEQSVAEGTEEVPGVEVAFPP